MNVREVHLCFINYISASQERLMFCFLKGNREKIFCSQCNVKSCLETLLKKLVQYTFLDHQMPIIRTA
jgi:hypothetical protein